MKDQILFEKPKELIPPVTFENPKNLIKPFTIKSIKCEKEDNPLEKSKDLKKSDHCIRPIEFISDDVKQIAQNFYLPLQSTFGEEVKSLVPYIGQALQNFKNDGYEIPCVLPIISQNLGHGNFNFELALKKKVIRIVDTADGEKSRLSYCIEVKIYLKNGQFSDYVETVESDKIKNFSWLYRATNSLAKLPEDKDEKIELIRIIQSCIESQNVPTEVIYPNSGWRFIKDIGWRYVYGSGTIGIQGNLIHTVRCDEEFVFPPYSFVQAEIFKEALNMTKICRSSCASTILFLFTHAATMSTFFEECGYPINFVLGIVGVTNSRKTSLTIELTRIFRQNKKVADAEFTSTACGIEKMLSKFKDAPILIDDFYPGETRAEQLAQNKKLETLVRFYGNRVPKRRMDDYTGTKEKYFPIQGVCVITMELIAGVQSSLSRMMLVEIDKKEVNNEFLSFYQKHPHILSMHIFDFIQWETKNQNKIMQIVENQMPNLRTQYEFEYQRFGEMFAVFHLIAQFIGDYGKNNNFWTTDESVAFIRECDLVIITVLRNMEKKLKKTDKGILTLHALTEAIETKKVDLIQLNDDTCKIKAVAYEDESRIFVRTNLLKKIVEEYCFYYKIEMFFTSEDEIITALDRLEVLEIYKKDAKRERARKLPIQKGNHLRYLYILKSSIKNKVGEI